MPKDTPLCAKYYIEKEYFDIEKENIFYRSWHCVCHISEVAEPGDSVTSTVVDEKIFLVCDKDGQLHTYYNICRHRGHPLVEGTGKNKRVLTCPYHA